MSLNLRRIGSLTKSELKSQFVSPVIYVFMIVFLALHGFFTLRMGGFFEGGEASLDGAFFWHPWLYLILVPAVGMHLWSDERRDGTLELLFTYPIMVTEAVIGKFLASLIVLFLSIAGTFPLAATVFYLGSPDPGPMICGYLGSFLIAAGFLAVTCFTSSLTRSPVVSFVLSLTACLFLNLAGWGPVLEIFRGFNAPAMLIEFIAGFSCITHFQNLQRGVVQLSDIIYFATVIIFFLSLNGLVLDNRRNHRHASYAFAGAFVIAVAVNIVFSFMPLKLDCTSGRIYSLSDSAEKIISRVTQSTPVTITFYFSETHPDMPPAIKSFAARIWTLLEQFARLNPDIHIAKVNPLPDSEAEDNARANGISGSPQPTGESVYCGIAVKCVDHLVPIPAVTPEGEPLLEYQLCAAISQVTQGENRKHVAVLSSQPVYTETAPDVPNSSWMVFSELVKNYTVDFLFPDPDMINLDPDTTAVLIVVHPLNVPEGVLYEIDQYLLKGGKVLVFLDAYPFAAALKSEYFNAPPASRFDPLLATWGVRMTSQPITDFSLAARDRNTAGVYVQRLTLGRNQMSDNAFTYGVNQLDMFAPVGFLITAADKSKYEVFLHTSDSGITFPLHTLLENRPIRPDELQGRLGIYALGVRIAGDFHTAFRQGRPKPADEVDIEALIHDSPTEDTTHYAASIRPGEVVLVGDIDFLTNTASVRERQTAFGPVPTPINDNIFFFLNLVDILAGDPELASIRVKPPSRRPLERIEAMTRAAAERSQDIIQTYENKLESLQSTIEEVRRSKDGRSSLTPESEKKLKELEAERRNVSEALKLQRRELRREIDALQLKLEIFNIVLIPLLLLMIGTITVVRRYRKCGAK